MRIATATAALLAAACSVFIATTGDAGRHPIRVASPSAYPVPAGVRVTTSAGLATALGHGGTIVLADGDYDAPHVLSLRSGTRLYAEHVGRAVLHAGLSIGTGPALVRGVSFSVRDLSKTLKGAAVDVWGAGRNTVVEDVRIDGHARIPYALLVHAPEGFVGRRIVARGLTSDGIAVDTYPRHILFAHAPLLADVDVSQVARPKPGSAHGTAEACLWLGVQITVQRARVSHCAWMDVWTGFNSVGGRYSELDIDDAPVGVYVEHYTTESIFSRLLVGSHVRVGVNCEWADPAYGRRPASVRNVIRDSTFESYETGVFLDEGTTQTSVETSLFRGQRVAAIVDFRGRGNSFRGNDYAGIGPSAIPISYDHG